MPNRLRPITLSTFCVYFYTEHEKNQNVPQEEKLHVGVNSVVWEMPMATQRKEPLRIHRRLKKKPNEKMRGT